MSHQDENNIDLSQFFVGVNTEDLMRDERTPIPEGEYTLSVEAMEIKKTKAGTGKYVEATLTVVGPSQIGRKVWSRFNIQNPSQKAQEIGQRDLYKFSVACGLAAPTNMNAYLGKRLGATIIISDDGNNNDVKKFVALDKGKAVAKPAAKPVSKPAAPAVEAAPEAVQEANDLAASESMPWED